MPINIFFIKACLLYPFMLIFLLACSDSGDSKDKSDGSALLQFSDVTVVAGLSYSVGDDSHVLFDQESAGVTPADINGDGYLDFFIAHGSNEPGKLFINNQDGTFQNITADSGIITTNLARGGLFVDIDGDGHNDLLIPEGAPEDDPSPANLISYKNNGDNTFTQQIDNFGIVSLGPTFSISAGDFDKNGYLDIAIAHYFLRPSPGIFEGWLWENMNGSLSDVTHLLDIPIQKHPDPELDPDKFQWNYAPVFSDVNNDGYQDFLMVANFENSFMNINHNGLGFSLSNSGVFTDEAGMGSAIGDYDNDGDLDWFITSIWHPDVNFAGFFAGRSGNRFYRNDGEGNFQDITDTTGTREGFFGWGACFADFDNDGDLDLFHVNGYGDDESLFGEAYSYFMKDPSVFFLNNGDGTFTEKASDVNIGHIGQGRGLSCLDYDNDGYIDILIANLGAPPNLYNNTSKQENNFLHVKLKGLLGNHQGVGAKIWITIDGKKQLRELRLGSNYLSNNPVIAYFGLGKAKKVDQVKVEWNDQNSNITEIENVDANQVITIKHPYLN